MDFSWQYFFFSAAGMALLTILAMHLALVPWRRSVGSHWTERARLLWPARRVQVGLAIAVGTSAFILGLLDRQEKIVGTLSFLGIACGYLGGSFFSTREIEPRYRFLVWLNEMFWALLVQFGIFGILVGLMATMPNTLGPADWVRVVLGLLGMVVVATGLWLPLFKLFPRKPEPEEERLNAVVKDVAAQTGVTPRWTFYGKSPQARAAALVYLRSLVVTSRVMEILDDEELRAVLHHEMAHLREGLVVRLSRLLPLAGFAVFIFFPPVLHHYGFGGVMLLALCPFLCGRLAGTIARRMEHRADDAAIHGADPEKYARALEKFYEANQMPAVMRSNTLVHPHLYDRMLTAGVTPDYSRPDRPGPMAWPGWAVLLVPLTLFVFLMVQRAEEGPRPRRSRPAPALEVQR